MAPVYDVMATTQYPGVDQTLGMYVGGARQVGGVTVTHRASEEASWGMPEATARLVIEEVVERVPDAVKREARSVPGLPPSVAERALERGRASREPKMGPAAISLPTPNARQVASVSRPTPQGWRSPAAAEGAARSSPRIIRLPLALNRRAADRRPRRGQRGEEESERQEGRLALGARSAFRSSSRSSLAL